MKQFKKKSQLKSIKNLNRYFLNTKFPNITYHHGSTN